MNAVSDPEAARANEPSRRGPTAPNGKNLPQRSILRRRRRPIAIVIIHRSALFRAGLRHAFAGSRFRIKVECSALGDLPRDAVREEQPVILLDITDSDTRTVLSQIRFLRDREDTARIVLLSNHCRSEELLAFIAAGADGFLSTGDISGDALLQSLELVLLGCVVIPRGLNGTLRHGLARLDDAMPPIEIDPACAPPLPADQPAAPDSVSRLSKREQMVLRELMRGASNKHIARAINIAEATVKVHIKSLLRKIGVSNRTQAAMWAMDHCPKISILAGLLSGAIA